MIPLTSRLVAKRTISSPFLLTSDTCCFRAILLFSSLFRACPLVSGTPTSSRWSFTVCWLSQSHFWTFGQFWAGEKPSKGPSTASTSSFPSMWVGNRVWKRKSSGNDNVLCEVPNNKTAPLHWIHMSSIHFFRCQKICRPGFHSFYSLACGIHRPDTWEHNCIRSHRHYSTRIAVEKGSLEQVWRKDQFLLALARNLRLFRCIRHLLPPYIQPRRAEGHVKVRVLRKHQ